MTTPCSIRTIIKLFVGRGKRDKATIDYSVFDKDDEYKNDDKFEEAMLKYSENMPAVGTATAYVSLFITLQHIILIAVIFIIGSRPHSRGIYFTLYQLILKSTRSPWESLWGGRDYLYIFSCVYPYLNIKAMITPIVCLRIWNRPVPRGRSTSASSRG